MDMIHINEDDRAEVMELYDLTLSEVFEAEKLYHRSTRSFFACCKVVASKKLAQKQDLIKAKTHNLLLNVLRVKTQKLEFKL
jgi:hypothetical protein